MIFEYQARAQTGEVQTGTVEAVDKDSALQILQGSNLVVVSIKSAEEQSIYLKQFGFFQKVSSKDLAIFSRQLATLFSASVSLAASLHTLTEQTQNVKLQDALLEISANVDGGMTFDEALAKYPDIFSNFYVQIVKAGERSGSLDKVLIYLADYTEREHTILSKIRGSMIYPAFVMGVFALVGIAMLLFVIPQLISVLEQSGSELPLITRVIASASEFVKTRWYVLIFLFLAVPPVVYKFSKTKQGRNLWHVWKLKLPIFGKIFKNIYLFRFTESFGLLIRGGVDLGESLAISANVLDNDVYKKIILDARDKVIHGVGLAEVLKKHSEISPLVSQMIAVGEKTGKLDEILKDVAKFYEQEVMNAVDNLVSLVEPILIVVMGLGVALLVAGVLLPIYSGINTLK